MRKQPDISPLIAITSHKLAIIEQVREYELITPLYGGGVTPAEADPITVVRATEIRGQLRFWWRACRGGQFNGDLKKLKEAENNLWGKACKKKDDGLSPEQTVQIIVEPLQVSKEIEPFKVEKDKKGKKRSKHDSKTGIPAYAAFPLQHTDKELQQVPPPRKKVRADVRFRLTISFPVDRQEDIEAALWAWETFGGIGARTRRGFGALRCISIQENNTSKEIQLPPATQPQARQWIQDQLNKYVVGGQWASSVPHLKHQKMTFKLVSGRDTKDSLVVWEYLINRLKAFRQQRDSSTKPQANHPGRSVWPEPSEIRQLTHQSLPAHSNPIPNPPVHKFPRAVFGLPIIFQFKDRNQRNVDDPHSDPRKTVLQPTSSERFASPLILKPLHARTANIWGWR